MNAVFVLVRGAQEDAVDAIVLITCPEPVNNSKTHPAESVCVCVGGGLQVSGSP